MYESEVISEGIVATEADVGRRVCLPVWSGYALAGKLIDHKGCGRCDGPCCFVIFDGEKYPVATRMDRLEWLEDGVLI